MEEKPFGFGNKQKAQSLVEFAISLMVILLLLSGAVDFGLGFFSYVAIRDAAQEGALYGSIDPTGNIEGRVRASSPGPVNMASITSVHVNITYPASVCTGNPLTVTIVYDYPVSMALVGIITGPTIPIHASATSIILTPACP